MMVDYAELTFHDFLGRIAARTPSPGGGSVAAAAGCLAAAMARMVAGYSVGAKTEPDKRKRIESVAGRLALADQLLRALISQDAEAYARLAAAAKGAGGDAHRQRECGEAVLAAIAVPMEMVAVSANLLTILDEFKALANPRLLSDLGVAAVLAEATAMAAAYSVRVNVPELDNALVRERILAELTQALQRCGHLRSSIEQHVRAHLEAKQPAGR